MFSRPFVFALWCTLFCVAPWVFAEPQPRPNILVLMAEDMSDRVGAFGDPVAVTPSLDRLAEQGVRYPNTFTAAGVCAPSRAAHIMGMHPISFGGQHMRASSAPLGGYMAVPPPQVKAYPELLRGAGYYTWTDHKLDYQFSGVLSGSGPFTIWDEEGGDGHWRHRDSGQPFYGLINFAATHESGVFTPLGSWPHSLQHLFMQIMRAFTVPAVGENSLVTPAQVIIPPYYPDTPIVRNDMARHYNNIAVMDRQVGEILAQLEADGLDDSTIVIWTTDHGDGLPRAKRELFDSGIKVPMIIRWPEAYRPPGVAASGIDPRLISFVDLAPTLLQLAGVNLPSYLQGRDFIKGAPREYVYASRDRIDEVTDRQRAVRDGRYKYILSWYPQQPGGHHLAFRDNMDMMLELWSMLEAGELNAVQRQWFEAPGEERLFDLVSDPHELNNLADELAYKVQLQRMRNALAAWQARVDDWSEDSEADMVARFRPHGSVPRTAAPEWIFSKDRVLLSSASEGASIGYRIDGGQWRLYTGPVNLNRGSELEARAVRYGWEESETVELWAP
jgi:N-sulfoglucosamine sulfohydrolase